LSLVSIKVTGDMGAAMRDEVKVISSRLRRAVELTARGGQAVLRQQARAAGFRDSGRALANAWRMKVYPASPSVITLNPAAEIKTNMPIAVEAFDKGVVITNKGHKWLVWPTGFNALLGRVKSGSKGGMRVTPEQMAALQKSKQTFVIKSKSNPAVSLWCIRVFAATGLKRGGRKGVGRLKLFVGNGTEVATGKVKGQQAWRKSLLKQGFIPMFFMTRRVTLRKRLDMDAVRAMVARDLAANVLAELRW